MQQNTDLVLHYKSFLYKKDEQGEQIINGVKYKEVAKYDNSSYVPEVSYPYCINIPLNHLNYPQLMHINVPINPIQKEMEIEKLQKIIDEQNKMFEKWKAEDELKEKEVLSSVTNIDKVISDIESKVPESQKRKRGRPRKNTIVTNEGENRKYKANVQYMNKRYKDDEEFKTKCLQNGKVNYQLKKEEKEIIGLLSKKQLKSMYNRKYREKSKLIK